METLSHITHDGLLLTFDASFGYLSILKFVECSHQFSCRRTLIEKSVCKHGMSRRNVVIIIAGLIGHGKTSQNVTKMSIIFDSGTQIQ